MANNSFLLPDDFSLPSASNNVEDNKGDDISEIYDSLDNDYDDYDDYDDHNNRISQALGSNTSFSIEKESGLEGLLSDDNDDYFDSLDFSDDNENESRNLINIDEILGKAIEMRASDVHLSSDMYVSFSILGEIVHMKEFGVIPAMAVQRAYTNITTNVAQDTFATNLDLDTSYKIKKGPHKDRRFRLSVGRSFATVYMVFRIISDNIPTPEDLGVPKYIEDWTQLPNGMVLICGPTGTGKSTTFASLINKINMTQAKKLITVERPIEYVYPNDGMGLVTQREVGKDTRSFSSALTAAMRQAPDVIMIGEVRDREEVDALLRASESGHLAFSTMHTNSPPGTINRIMSLYEGDEQLRILSSLKDNVRGIANQVLVKTRKGNDRFAVQSVLQVTPEVADMIGRGAVSEIQNYMIKREETMEHQLVKAVLEGKCRPEEARSYCIFPEMFDRVLREKVSKLRKR